MDTNISLNELFHRALMDLATTRTASAAWKASARDNRNMRKHYHRALGVALSRAEAAEQRVAELEEACEAARTPLLNSMSNSRTSYDVKVDALKRIDAALNK